MSKVLTLQQAEAIQNPAKAKARLKLARLYRRWRRAGIAAESYWFIASARADRLCMHECKCDLAYRAFGLNFMRGIQNDYLYPPTAPRS